MRPLLNTATRVLIDSASPWSWVTKTNVMPTSRWIAFSSTCISSRSLRSSAPSGSSSSRTLGSVDEGAGEGDALALPTAQLVGTTIAERTEADDVEHLQDPAAALRLGHTPTFMPYSTFSPTERCGNRA